MVISSTDMVRSDRSVLAWASARIAVPRVDIPPELYSFVLHAPMELLARGALMPYVQTDAREKARGRIEVLVAGYERVSRWACRAGEVPVRDHGSNCTRRSACGPRRDTGGRGGGMA